MNDAALLQPASYRQIRVREPAGERTFDDTLTIGGEGAQIVVPGADAVALRIDRRDGVWTIEPAAAGAVRFDGQPLSQPRDLRRGDVLGVGDAHVVVTDVWRTLLRIEVRHLVGNLTIAPMGLVAALATELDDGDVEIRSVAVGDLTDTAAPPAQASAAGSRRRWWAGAIAAALALLGVVLLISSLEPVTLDVLPADARVRTPGTLLAIHSAGRVLVLPGEHVFRAEREGYTPARLRLSVSSDAGAAAARFRLVKLPGRLKIDTGGVSASVSIDGAEAGRAPGEIRAAAGRRTLLIRAPRYLDNVSTVNVAGANALQDISVKLQPAWGTLVLSSVPAATRITIDGKDSGIAPASLEVSTGVRRVQLSAPGFETWESSLVVRPGETLNVGPITLGQPDAQLVVTSTPRGAEVSVAGTFRGRTPATIRLPPGIGYDVVVSLPGRAPFTQSVFAEPGRRIDVNAGLSAVNGRVTIEGEPAGAELLVDGVARGRVPQTLQLPMVPHRLEVRSEGFMPFTGTVTPAPGLERRVSYKLVPSDRGLALQESAPVIKTGSGYALRLVPGGSFPMGSDRREQGRRPNEGFRPVTLRRAFYIGVTEITNEEFRRFRSGHASGYLEKRSLDLDAQPVSQVTWQEAVEYCNWLSAQEGLPAAYEQRGSKYVLVRPVTTGFRLPTEAEWEFAARYAGPDRVQRFIWGDSLPIPGSAGNLAGAEASDLLPATIEGYKDGYPIASPVARFPANPLGLHDMAGNVSEWVNDLYASFVDSTPVTDPLGPDDGSRHVIRGASWQSSTISDLRLAWRDSAEEIHPALGFRIARYAE